MRWPQGIYTLRALVQGSKVNSSDDSQFTAKQPNSPLANRVGVSLPVSVSNFTASFIPEASSSPSSFSFVVGYLHTNNMRPGGIRKSDGRWTKQESVDGQPKPADHLVSPCIVVSRYLLEIHI